MTTESDKFITIPKNQYDNLMEHSRLVSKVAIYVEDFCLGEETILQGVLRLLSQYHELKSNSYYERLYDLNKEQDI